MDQAEWIGGFEFLEKEFQCAFLHTDRTDSQLYRAITENCSTAPRVPMGIRGSVCDPRTQI